MTLRCGYNLYDLTYEMRKLTSGEGRGPWTWSTVRAKGGRDDVTMPLCAQPGMTLASCEAGCVSPLCEDTMEEGTVRFVLVSFIKENIFLASCVRGF
jgi:hypothetical protein